MKKLFFILTIFFISTLSYADEIHLNDGRIIKCKVIKITPTVIEYNPEGDKEYEIFPRGQISKIIFDNGILMEFNEGGEVKKKSDTKEEVNDETKDVTKEETKKPPRDINDGINVHDGFYLRILYGFGSGETKINDYYTSDVPEKSDLQIEGDTGMFRVQVGYAFGNSLILYGELGSFVYNDPEVKWQGINQEDTNTDYSISNLGIGISYYIMPINIYITASLCASGAVIDGTIMKTDNISGSGIFLAIGKEWWVSDNWALGASLFYYSDSLKTNDNLLEDDFTITDRIYGIAFSATYN